jgi:hypothetical protein
LEEVRKYKKLDIAKSKCYKIKKENEVLEAYYLGAHYWFIDVIRGFEKFVEIDNNFVRIDPRYFSKMMVEEIATSQTIDRYRSDANYSEDIQQMIDEDNQVYTIKVERTHAIEMITQSMLGKNWVDAITYYYFTGGKFKWSDLDLTTFETKDSIEKLAIARKDKEVLERLKAA